MRQKSKALWIVAFVVSSGAAFGADSSVPLYTNKDLAKFRSEPASKTSPSTASKPVPTMTPEEYAFVQSFIDKQYARLDAERERSSARRAADGFGNPGDHYVAPYGGYYGFGAYPYYPHFDGRDPNASNIYRHGFGNPDRFPAHYARPSARFRDNWGGGYGGGKHGHGGHGGGGGRGH